MAELRDLNARVGNGDGTAGFQAVEEPFLDRVVVKRAVDVNRPNGSPVHVSRC